MSCSFLYNLILSSQNIAPKTSAGSQFSIPGSVLRLERIRAGDTFEQQGLLSGEDGSYANLIAIWTNSLSQALDVLKVFFGGLYCGILCFFCSPKHIQVAISGRTRAIKNNWREHMALSHWFRSLLEESSRKAAVLRSMPWCVCTLLSSGIDPHCHMILDISEGTL